MRLALAAAAAFAALFPAGAAAQGETGAQAPPPPVQRIRPSKIVLVGDSTTAVIGGWGPSFCAYHVTSTSACINLARGGRSSGSYRTEGSWDVALAEMRTPGYSDVWVLIQFGHNDQPGKPGRSTDLKTEFPANLRRYVAEARAAGARPVLLTPLIRRQFKDGVLINDLQPWAETVRAVAAETGVPLVDLNARSAEAVQALGPALSARFAQVAPSPEVAAAALTGTTTPGSTGVPAAPAVAPAATQDNAAVEPLGQARLAFDYTHLGRTGADFFAAMVAQELAKNVPQMRPLLVP
jgi:lysophospholipase L1-like esterase